MDTGIGASQGLSWESRQYTVAEVGIKQCEMSISDDFFVQFDEVRQDMLFVLCCNKTAFFKKHFECLNDDARTIRAC